MDYFEKAGISQADEILKLYNSCTMDLLKKNILQWGIWDDAYPNKKFINNSIQRGELYILKIKQDIVGSVVLNQEQSEEWKTVNWTTSTGKFLVIHALVVNPLFQNRGLGKKLLNYCEVYAKKHAYKTIRLDCFKNNPFSNKLYIGFGYQNKGTIIFETKPEGQKEYFCYEKIL